jgi:hypothetical protein
MGELPQSSALDEAKPESLGEVTNLDPEKWTPEHVERLVVMLRAHAERYARLRAEPRAAKPGAKPKGSSNPKGLTVDDLGL